MFRKSPEFRRHAADSETMSTISARYDETSARIRALWGRGLIQRVPFLVSAGQLPASHNELRRFVEVVLWSVYFTDHPIEWKSFSDDPTRGFAKAISDYELCFSSLIALPVGYRRKELFDAPGTSRGLTGDGDCS